MDRMVYTTKNKRRKGWKEGFSDPHFPRKRLKLVRKKWRNGDVKPYVPDALERMAEELAGWRIHT